MFLNVNDENTVRESPPVIERGLRVVLVCSIAKPVTFPFQNIFKFKF